MPTLWIQVVVVYNSDDQQAYNHGLSSTNAIAGGFSIAAAGTPPNYPRGWRMRHLYGVDTQGAFVHHKLPVASNSGALWTSATSFALAYLTGSASFNIQGRISERRVLKV